MSIIDWLTGAPDPYMPRWHCLNGDTLTGWTLITLDVLIPIAYMAIAARFYMAHRRVAIGSRMSALILLVAIFVLCGLNGYAMDALMFWTPAYRAQIPGKLALLVVSVAYLRLFASDIEEAMHARSIQGELDRTNQMLAEANRALVELIADRSDIAVAIVEPNENLTYIRINQAWVDDYDLRGIPNDWKGVRHLDAFPGLYRDYPHWREIHREVFSGRVMVGSDDFGPHHVSWACIPTIESIIFITTFGSSDRIVSVAGELADALGRIDDEVSRTLSDVSTWNGIRERLQLETPDDETTESN